ncbi:MAG: hypothetical protein K6E18_02910, partial [Lachnospiraceae bacterium]|nr:hypothetical protein [Lachnospiraceae bacterium]
LEGVGIIVPLSYHTKVAGQTLGVVGLLIDTGTGFFSCVDTLHCTDVNKKAYNTQRLTSDFCMVAQWDYDPYTFKINYNLDGGYFKNSDLNEGLVYDSFTVQSDDIAFPSPVKSGCFFAGWYADSAFTTPISGIPAGSYLDITNESSENDPKFEVYAKWTPAKLPAVTVKDAKYKKTGTAALNFGAVDGAISYEISFSTSKKFTKKTTSSYLVSKARTATVTNLLKKTYYFRVRAVSTDSTGSAVSGPWSEAKSVKIKKGVREVKAKKNSIKLKSLKITDGNLVVKASAPKRVKSSDTSYYLVSLEPSTGKVTKAVSALPKLKSLSVTLPVKNETGMNLVQGRYALAIKSGKSYKVISSSSFIDNPEDLAAFTEPFPTPSSKKGLQGVTHGGVKHTFTNFFLNDYIDVSKSASNAYKYNGQTYYFDRMQIQVLINWAKACNREGIVCTAQFMLTWPGTTYSFLVAPGARDASKKYFLMNGTDKKARETWEALFTCIAESMAEQNVHLDNWVLGNEVNVGNEGPGWCYHGNLSEAAAVKQYAACYRIAYYAVRSNLKNSRVYICTDHTFNDWEGDWGCKGFMDLFDKQMNSFNKKIEWNLAYHAYPSILTSAATWNDSHTTNGLDSTFVSPKNLNVLTDYVKKNFGKNCRIILSEQGFTHTQGFDVQGAAVAYTYYKAEFNNMIDAVIFRAYADDPGEVAQGLAFGLSANQGVWNMFVNMDTPNSVKYTNPYLTAKLGANWTSKIPGWNASKFSKMK